MDSIETVRSLIDEIGNIAAHQGRDLLENEESRIKLLEHSRKLAIIVDKPENVVFQTPLMPTLALCARLAVDMRLFHYLTDADGASVSVSKLAALSSADESLVARIMRVLAGMNYVQESGVDSFVATPVAKAFTYPALQAGNIHCWDQGVPIYHSMLQYFRNNGFKCPSSPTKGPLQYAYGTDLESFEYWSSQPEVIKNFDLFMTGVRASRPIWADWFPVREELIQEAEGSEDSPLLVDVAGGRGHDLVAFKQRFPEVQRRLILQDLPHAIAGNPALNGIEQMEHDFFTPQPICGAKVYFFHMTLHNWSDEEAKKILRNIATAMKTDYSRLYLNENILPDTGCSLFSAEMDIVMLALHGSGERTRRQWTLLLDSAGLRIKKIWPGPGNTEGIIEAVRRE